MFDVMNKLRERGPINEAVYAVDRSPYIKIEKLFQGIKDATGGDVSKFDRTARQNLRKIGDILEETFNIGELLFINSGIVIDPITFKLYDIIKPIPQAACTIGSKYSIIDYTSPFTKRSTVKTPHGIAFKDKNLRILIYISPAVFEDLTAGEITAVILHEIGHSFDETVGSKTKWLYSVVTNPLGMTFIMAYMDIWKMALSILDKLPKDRGNTIIGLYKKYETIWYHVWEYINPFYMKIPSFIRRFDHLIGRNIDLSGKALNWALEPLRKDIIFNSLGYESEKVSDNFAAACGYGAELGSALRKLNRIENNLVESSATMAAIMSTLSLFQDLLLEIDAPHMIPLDRMKSIRNYLKDCHEGELDPKTRAHLSNQIADLEKIISLQAETDKKKYSRKLGAMIRLKSVSGDEAIEDLRTLLPFLQKDYGNLE